MMMMMTKFASQIDANSSAQNTWEVASSSSSSSSNLWCKSQCPQHLGSVSQASFRLGVYIKSLELRPKTSWGPIRVNFETLLASSLASKLLTKWGYQWLFRKFSVTILHWVVVIAKKASSRLGVLLGFFCLSPCTTCFVLLVMGLDLKFCIFSS